VETTSLAPSVVGVVAVAVADVSAVVAVLSAVATVASAVVAVDFSVGTVGTRAFVGTVVSAVVAEGVDAFVGTAGASVVAVCSSVVRVVTGFFVVTVVSTVAADGTEVFVATVVTPAVAVVTSAVAIVTSAVAVVTSLVAVVTSVCTVASDVGNFVVAEAASVGFSVAVPLPIFSSQWKEPMVLMQMSLSQPPLSTAHSLRSTQVWLSSASRNPGLQLHMYDPLMLMHKWSQPPLRRLGLGLHSFTSTH
jgi:hypothetical protein